MFCTVFTVLLQVVINCHGNLKNEIFNKKLKKKIKLFVIFLLIVFKVQILFLIRIQ